MRDFVLRLLRGDGYWLNASDLADQRARKALTCMVYTQLGYF